MSLPRKKYDREFKLRAVELSYSRPNVREVAEELGIRPKLLYRWRSEFSSDKELSFPGNGKQRLSDEASELARLKQELEDLRMERDILKKAVGIFSKSDGKSTSS